jgi:NTE family protein
MDAKVGKSSRPPLAARVARDYPVLALVLQGGGALGAYQAGVYESLEAEGLAPHWVAGISIGAFNAAIIAGNPPGERVARLREFWEAVCQSPWWPAQPVLPWLQDVDWPQLVRAGFSGLAAWRALTEGQAGFFVPRLPSPLWRTHASPATASWYDTTPLRDTLQRLIDFDRLNDARRTRVTVGAVNVRTGNFAYFDNTRDRLGPEHIMASGALPPGFPAVEIDGEFYWDGGLVSNTPLYRVLTEESRRNALVFQVDLWPAQGELPRDLGAVAERMKEIQYSSRTRLVTEYMHRSHRQRRLLHDLLALVPEDRRDDPVYRRAEHEASGALTTLVHLIYRNQPYEGHYKDYEFSESSMRAHWQSGMADMQHTLAHHEWLALPSAEHPFVTHDVHRR